MKEFEITLKARCKVYLSGKSKKEIIEKIKSDDCWYIEELTEKNPVIVKIKELKK